MHTWYVYRYSIKTWFSFIVSFQYTLHPIFDYKTIRAGTSVIWNVLSRGMINDRIWKASHHILLQFYYTDYAFIACVAMRHVRSSIYLCAQSRIKRESILLPFDANIYISIYDIKISSVKFHLFIRPVAFPFCRIHKSFHDFFVVWNMHYSDIIIDAISRIYQDTLSQIITRN